MILNTFHCKRCEHPILLPLETLQQTFAYQEHPSTDIYPLAIACSRCKTVESYTEQDLKDFEGASNHSHNWVVVEPWLKCVEAACEESPPLFVEVIDSSGTRLSKARLRDLTWGSVRCQKGHEILKPMW